MFLKIVKSSMAMTVYYEIDLLVFCLQNCSVKANCIELHKVSEYEMTLRKQTYFIMSSFASRIVSYNSNLKQIFTLSSKMQYLLLKCHVSQSWADSIKFINSIAIGVHPCNKSSLGPGGRRPSSLVKNESHCSIKLGWHSPASNYH